MVFSLGVSYWLTLALAVPAAGFLVRIFIILHDCGHGSFIKSRRANDVLGFLCGVIVFTPYHYWRHNHALHHATAGNLDRRGTGDIWTMTVKEYAGSSFWRRLGFRLYRNPLILFVLAPMYMFLVHYRFASPRSGARWHVSVLWSNLAILAVALLLGSTVGFKAYVLIQLPLVVMSAAAGVWLFYVQHQFEGVYWDRQKDWDYVKAALQGSSYYRLPKTLQWFSGNIGFHHIHHLSPRVPNYFLERCHRENAMFRKVRVLGLWESFRCIRFRLWDEERRKLVGVGPSYFL